MTGSTSLRCKVGPARKNKVGNFWEYPIAFSFGTEGLGDSQVKAWSIYRRYSQFEVFNRHLVNSFSQYRFPDFPGKVFFATCSMEKITTQRRKAFQKLLQLALSKKDISDSEFFLKFIDLPNGSDQGAKNDGNALERSHMSVSNTPQGRQHRSKVHQVQNLSTSQSKVFQAKEITFRSTDRPIKVVVDEDIEDVIVYWKICAVVFLLTTVWLYSIKDTRANTEITLSSANSIIECTKTDHRDMEIRIHPLHSNRAIGDGMPNLTLGTCNSTDTKTDNNEVISDKIKNSLVESIMVEEKEIIAEEYVNFGERSENSEIIAEEYIKFGESSENSIHKDFQSMEEPVNSNSTWFTTSNCSMVLFFLLLSKRLSHNKPEEDLEEIEKEIERQIQLERRITDECEIDSASEFLTDNVTPYQSPKTTESVLKADDERLFLLETEAEDAHNAYIEKKNVFKKLTTQNAIPSSGPQVSGNSNVKKEAFTPTLSTKVQTPRTNVPLLILAIMHSRRAKQALWLAHVLSKARKNVKI